jgi:hypothetical protein
MSFSSNRDPYIIKFSSIASFEGGNLVPFDKLPFDVVHCYCIGPVQDTEIRGNHANINNSQVLIPIGGSVEIWLESPIGDIYHYILSSNKEGLFIPNGFWRKAKLNAGCYLLGLHSHSYDADDYIRNYEEFKRINNR